MTACRAAYLLACALACASPVKATENGGSVVPVGVQSMLPGLLMPSGNYLYNYNAFVKGFSARDSHGRDNGLGMTMSTEAHAFRLLHVADPGLTELGNLAFEANLVYTRTKLDMDYVDPSTAAGISDVTFGPSLGRHFGAWHDLFTLLATAPTGDYDPNRLANEGRNYWAIQASWAWTWYPRPDIDISGLAKVVWNGRNPDTDYRSGIETNLEYSANYYFAQHFFVGVSGFWHSQISDDKQYGRPAGENGNRINEVTLGPQFGWGTPRYGAYFSWKRSLYSKNTLDISQLWLNTFIAF